MKNKFNRLLSFLLIVATLCSLLGVFASAASTETDISVRMFYNRSFNDGWDCANGMSLGSGITTFVNHEYDDDFNYNYYAEFTEPEDSLTGGKNTLTIPLANVPTSGYTVLSFALKLPAESNQNYGLIASGKTSPGENYDFLKIVDGQVSVLDTPFGSVRTDEWIKFQYVMSWADSSRECTVTVDGGGINKTEVIPLIEGQAGASLRYVYFGMGGRTSDSPQRTYKIDDLVFYNTAQNLIAKEDLGLYGMGALISETAAKTVEIYGETILAPTDYIKQGLTMKVNVNWYMTNVKNEETGAVEHKKLNIYTADNGEAYGAPVKIDKIVYVPLMLVLQHLGLENAYAIREDNAIEISTGGTNLIVITMGETKASVSGVEVQLSGAPGYVTTEIGGKAYSYPVIPLDSVDIFFAQEGAENPLYYTYDEMGLILLTGKKNVWNRNENLAEMATLMEKFVFDYDAVNQGAGFGEQLVSDIKNYNNFSHPYLFANQDRWDTLRAVWIANNQAAYDDLMALTDAEKAALGIAGADPKGYSDTLNKWIRDMIKINVNDPAYILANGAYDPNAENAPYGVTTSEKMYAAGSEWLILDSNGNYLGMNPGSDKSGYQEYRGDLNNKNYLKYQDGYDSGGRTKLTTKLDRANYPHYSESVDITHWARDYQITRDLRYAQVVFDWISILGDTKIWQHWGPAHFLNTADGTTEVAIAYDWLCPAWDALVENNVARPTAETTVYKVYASESSKEVLYYMTAAEYDALGLPAATDKTVVIKTVSGDAVTYYTQERELSSRQQAQGVKQWLTLTPPSFSSVTTYDRKHIADIIYNQGVYEGWFAVTKNTTEHPCARMTSGYYWITKKDNWNAVCAKGMVLGALMVLEYADLDADRAQKTKQMLDIVMHHFFLNGLDEYAPDGAYYESASYWSYGTNSVFQMAAAYVSATGKDYGIMDSYGLDRTCYFAAYAESSDAQMWTYNDATEIPSSYPCNFGMKTEWFTWVGKYIGDSGLVDHRMYQLENGLKSVTIYDIFNYSPEDKGADSIKLDLAYYMHGLDGMVSAFSIRSSWEKGAMCVSIMGGENAVAHADLDAGTFMYWNGGHPWIWDLGADNYGISGIFTNIYYNGNLPTRFRYYRHGAEGNNCVLIASHQDVLPFGQRVNGTAPIVTQYSDENGAYAILDLLDIYSSEPELEADGASLPLVSTAQRGVLATDGYKTVVLQDQIIASKLETFYWFAHYSSNTIATFFSSDGRTCYMRYKQPTVDEEGKSHYALLRLTLVSPDSADKFYETGAGDQDMVLNTTFRNGTHPNYAEEKEYNRSSVRKICIKREQKLNFRVAVVFDLLPEEYYNYETGTLVNGVDTYPCSYEWTDLYNWKTQAAPDADDDTNQDGEDSGEATLGIEDLIASRLNAENYLAAGTAYGTAFAEYFAALSRIQKVWDLYGDTPSAPAIEKDYTECEEYLVVYRRLQRSMNKESENALLIGSALTGKR